jgi:hypothetical protein
MVRKIAVFLLFTCATSLAAADSLEPAAATGSTVSEVVAQWRAEHVQAMARAAQIRPKVIDVDWETYAFLIPAAGSLAGNFGTFFRSDVTLANRRSVDQIIAVLWVARGVNNSSSPVQRFTLRANTTTVISDFVSRSLGKSGLGSIVVIAQDSAGNVDTLGQIDGFSRIWTNQPGAPGTVSQDFPPVGVQDSLATSYGYGLRQDEQYRTNVGLVNLYETAQTFTIAVSGLRGSTTFTVTVQPYSMEQPALPAGIYGDLYLRISSGPNLNWWSAYGTSVDNITGDGWVSHVH